MPSSFGCIPQTPYTVISGDTSGETLGTLAGSAYFSALTSAMDQVCEIPPTEGATGTYTCTENATGVVASNILYTQKVDAEDYVWLNDGILELKVTEASYNSFQWYTINKIAIAAYAVNSTQGKYFQFLKESMIKTLPTLKYLLKGRQLCDYKGDSIY
jgi:hypothetical protein